MKRDSQLWQNCGHVIADLEEKSTVCWQGTTQSGHGQKQVLLWIEKDLHFNYFNPLSVIQISWWLFCSHSAEDLPITQQELDHATTAIQRIDHILGYLVILVHLWHDQIAKNDLQTAIWIKLLTKRTLKHKKLSCLETAIFQTTIGRKWGREGAPQWAVLQQTLLLNLRVFPITIVEMDQVMLAWHPLINPQHQTMGARAMMCSTLPVLTQPLAIMMSKYQMKNSLQGWIWNSTVVILSFQVKGSKNNAKTCERRHMKRYTRRKMRRQHGCRPSLNKFFPFKPKFSRGKHKIYIIEVIKLDKASSYLDRKMQKGYFQTSSGGDVGRKTNPPGKGK